MAVVQLGLRFAPGAREVLGSNPSSPIRERRGSILRFLKVLAKCRSESLKGFCSVLRVDKSIPTLQSDSVIVRILGLPPFSGVVITMPPSRSESVQDVCYTSPERELVS